ncbi:MAG: stage III sporulation AC/AD family protein [Oscillospiraceae bacterium]|jgi:stage III sporulation protein AD|nr:stage III sporulation AC/AD family protein [Oscillospiraceae bacterium]
MTVLLKIAGAVIAGSAFGLLVKKKSPETSLLLSVALAILAVMLCLDILAAILEFLRNTARAANIPDASLDAVLKTVGISIVAKLTADICKEAGQAAAASGVELAGAVAAVYVALPLLQTALDMIESLV